MKSYIEEIYQVLEKDGRFLSDEGILLKNKVYEQAMKLDGNIIKLLLTNPITKNIFFTEVDGVYIFDKSKFGWVIESEEFLPNSYTSFSQHIYLEDRHRNPIKQNDDVVLVFPYKDGVLEFDSTDSDDERNEMFYHEIIGKKDIDILKDPKVFTNTQKHTQDGIEDVVTFDDSDNLIMKGNNFIALHSLLPKYKGKIKLIYWDVLYNTNNDKVPYNDTFKHSSWLVMMKNRLEVAKKLLTPDGSIFIQCDDNEGHYLKVLMDEIFERKNFINTITVKTKIAGVSGSSEGKSFKDATEFIHVYSKNKDNFLLNPDYVRTPLYQHVLNYKATGKSWKYTTIIEDLGERQLIKEDAERNYKFYQYPNVSTCSINQFMAKNNLTEQEVYEQYYDRIFRTTNAQSSVRKTVMEETNDIPSDFVSIEYYPIKGKNGGQLTEILYKGKSRAMLMLLKDTIEIISDKPVYLEKVSTLWSDIEYNNLAKEGSVQLKYGKKPEKLIKRIIDVATQKGEIVLDAYLGSGTTAAVAHKLGRKYIGIEQLNSHYEKSLERLDAVIEGDQTGISTFDDVNWTGGGSFVSVELKKLSYENMELISNSNKEDLPALYDALENNPFISYRVDFDALAEKKGDFLALSEEEQRRFLYSVTEKNTLYVNKNDMNDPNLQVTDAEKEFTINFYDGGEE